MKKSIILILLMTIICGITACKKEEAKNSSVSSGISSSSVVSSSENTSSESSSAVNSEKGQFYTLQEAYDNGWLNQEQLLSIAYYSGNREDNAQLMGENYTPLPKNPDTLSEEKELEIKQTYLDESDDHYNVPVSLDNVEMFYFGTYNKCIVLFLDMIVPGFSVPGVVETVFIGDVAFQYRDANNYTLIIYK